MRLSKYLALFVVIYGAQLSGFGVSWTGLHQEAGTTGDWIRIEGEAFVPINTHLGRLLPFFYARGAKYGRSYLTDVTVSGGFRYVMDPSWAYGINTTYGSMLTRHDRWFHFVGFGAELYTRCLDFHINGRIPVGASRRSVTPPTVIGTFLDDSEVKLRTKLSATERSRWSIDGEIGYRLCLGGCIGYVRFFGGGQYCDQATDVRGMYIGAEAYNRELGTGGLQLKFGGYIGNTFSHVQGSLYIELRYAFGCKRKHCCNSLCNRLSDPIVQRLHPCVGATKGEVITESVTTSQYLVNGIWVAYEGDDLQTQIDLALANGGSNTMIFADGTFAPVVAEVTLNSGQVLVGGNAFLDAKGATSGAKVPWGDWGNFTTNPGVINQGISAFRALLMQPGSTVDTMTLEGADAEGLENTAPGPITARNVAIFPGGIRTGVRLTDGDGSIIENVSVEGGRSGFLLISTDTATLSNISTTDNAAAGIELDSSSNILIDGWTSSGEGLTPLVLIGTYSNILLNGVRLVDP